MTCPHCGETELTGGPSDEALRRFERNGVTIVFFMYGTVQVQGGDDELMELVSRLLAMRSKPADLRLEAPSVIKSRCACPLRHWIWSHERAARGTFFSMDQWVQECDRVVELLGGSR